ncbi:hypothetical protein C8J57DRAFT_1521843 [Mycena rebaudengoi]|nr:hypothetical protein C8J57DRAFT_1521843 [Mycena rebaudengoi]
MPMAHREALPLAHRDVHCSAPRSPFPRAARATTPAARVGGDYRDATVICGIPRPPLPPSPLPHRTAPSRSHISVSPHLLCLPLRTATRRWLVGTRRWNPETHRCSRVRATTTAPRVGGDYHDATAICGISRPPLPPSPLSHRTAPSRSHICVPHLRCLPLRTVTRPWLVGTRRWNPETHRCSRVPCPSHIAMSAKRCAPVLAHRAAFRRSPSPRAACDYHDRDRNMREVHDVHMRDACDVRMHDAPTLHDLPPPPQDRGTLVGGCAAHHGISITRQAHELAPAGGGAVL